MHKRGFTLIELMITIAILAILIAIAIPRYAQLVRKSNEGATKGNLGNLRSAISVYYADNDQIFPFDNLGSLVHKYIPIIPQAKMPPYHDETTDVQTAASPTDGGGWSYNNVYTSDRWGHLTVSCLHNDYTGSIWSTN